MSPARRALFFLFSLLGAIPLSAQDRPNILWISAEDISPHFGCYGDPHAITPNLDALAAAGVRYTRAFTTAGVCAPCRSGIITGMYQNAIGTHHMRCEAVLPGWLKPFPAYLREAGYYCTNNSKTDYQFSKPAPKEIWDENSAQAHWKNRKEGQPFFAVFNFTGCHESAIADKEKYESVTKLLKPEQRQDPDKLTTLPPYYPDTPVVRKELARFHDCVSKLDEEVGQLLRQLEEDGLADDTIVFFYSDHGSGLPRHKRLLHDSGMRVPLLVRFPEKYRALAPAGPGGTVDRLVTFVDFAPTVLSLAGVEVPGFIQGRAFLGGEVAAGPDYLYGFRDRVDEAYDCARSIRSKGYLYIRNFMPHLSWAQPSVYSDLGAIQREIAAHAAKHAETLTDAQRAYTAPTRPVEEFYDLEKDPENLVNLAVGDRTPEQQAALETHRAAFQQKRAELLDVAFLPEANIVDFMIEEDRPIRDITTGMTDHRPDLERVWAAADLVGFGTREELLALVHEGDAAVRFWAIIALRHAHPQDGDLLAELYDSMDDVNAAVRIEAAAWMAEASPDHRAEAIQVLGREVIADDWWTALRACRAVELLGTKAVALLPVMETLYARHRFAEGDGAMYLAFSSGAFLQQMGMPTEPWDFSPKP